MTCPLQKEVPITQIAISWVLAQPGVTSVTFGVSSPSQVAENVNAALYPFPAEEAGAILAHSDAIKEKIGTNCDVWNSAGGGRIQ